MIQRIQTLYLVLAALLLALFVGLASGWAEAIALDSAWLGWVGYGLAVVTAFVALAAVGLYKDRPLQRRVIYVAQWLDLALVVVVLVGLFVVTDPAATTAPVGLYLVALQPIVAYLFLRMARQRVTADIEVVKSMDRLR
ncbi:DUF4293 family protein [Rubrivirga sp. S365]|uniref:DUF4293 family protein n=1 Tax=Rubrivirga litoralis TaxID=3075598 RepID=A0ABU3BUA9_9BACT|nr:MULTISPECIES: DUF4293 family protein [unclassified Rubrivirga]MDT0632882.1 DUF4293 family protein [Rubrivirga sp. F394]MDT7857787.1 DUF4293 family protein [Rubrivirga sp. S365]